MNKEPKLQRSVVSPRRFPYAALFGGVSLVLVLFLGAIRLGIALSPASTFRTTDLTVDNTATISGLTNLAGGLELTTTQADTTTGTVNDFVINATTTVLRWTGNASVIYDGFKCGAADCVAGNNGRVLIVENASATNLATLSFTSNNAGSVAGNRILTISNTNVSLTPNSSANINAAAIFIYDGTSLRWRLLSFNSNFYNSASYNNKLELFATKTHITALGTAIVPTSCGTGPTCTTNCTDAAGRVTIGATGTGCTVPFNTTYTTAPTCTVTFEQSIVYTYTPGATSLVVTAAASAGDTFDYVCIGGV